MSMSGPRTPLAGAEEYAAQRGSARYEGMLHYYRGVAAFTAGNVVEARSRASGRSRRSQPAENVGDRER